MEKTLYLQASEKDISKYVIFSGDPGRVKQVVKHLENVREIAVNREFNTFTGTYKGVDITVTSTGIGGPSAAIAIEEMYTCGMEVAVRLGTVMGLQDDLLGKFIIPNAVMRDDGTSKSYVRESYPAVADFELVSVMNESVIKNNLKYVNKPMCSLDGFYVEMKESRLSKQMGRDLNKRINEVKNYNIVGIDMESATLLTLTNLMGIKGCVVTMTTVLENLKDYLKGDVRTKAEEDLVKVVLDGIVILDSKED